MEGLSAGGDVTHGEIEGADVVVGKNNRQQTGGRGDQNVTINNPHVDDDEAGTIRLFYELVNRIEGKLDQERREWRAAVDGLRHDIDELAKIAHETKARVDSIGDNMAQAVVLNQTHRRTFAAGFVLLTAPVPLYFDGFLRVIDLNWPIALMLALACYGLSAGFWHYMWWPR